MGKNNIVLIMFVVATTLLLQVSAKPKEGKFAKEYDDCFTACTKKCDADGKHYTDCEVACDEDCSELRDHDKVKSMESKSKQKELAEDIESKDNNKLGGRKRK